MGEAFKVEWGGINKMLKKRSKVMRERALFLRNEFYGDGRWNLPLIRRQAVNLSHVSLIACSDTRPNDNEANRQKGVHFFVDDYRFEGIYLNPEQTLNKYSQYAFLLSPDFSTYADMSLWRQMESVAKNRWCGAYWQSKGLTVVPTVSWSTPRSFEFCFDGIEHGAVVAVGTIGCRRAKIDFLRGYGAMMERVEPEAVLCFGKPFSEMRGNLISVDYQSSRRVVR